MTDILIAIIPTTATAVLAFGVARMNRHVKVRAKFQRRETELLFDSIESVGDLAELTATCYKSGEVMNGNLDKAIVQRKQSKEARTQYLKDVNSEMKSW